MEEEEEDEDFQELQQGDKEVKAEIPQRKSKTLTTKPLMLLMLSFLDGDITGPRSSDAVWFLHLRSEMLQSSLWLETRGDNM